MNNLMLFRFMTSMINYGLVFNIETLSGSFFINSVLMGAIRWGINIVFGVLDYRFVYSLDVLKMSGVTNISF